MRKNVKITDILAKFDSLRRTDIKNFQTNYFLTPVDQECFALENEQAAIFLSKEKNFYKLFYAFTSLHNFEMLLSQIFYEDVYLEIIAKRPPFSDFQKLLNKFFEYKTTYQKLYKKLEISNRTFDVSCKIDEKLIFDKLYSTFNIYFEHLMNADELKKLANENKVLTIYENGDMKSFLIYKTQGSKAYLNHIANYGSKENLIALWKMFYQDLNNHKVKYLDLWYDVQNKKAENMYHIEKFRPLGLYNFCYKKLS